jgi:hypothetical protein
MIVSFWRNDMSNFKVKLSEVQPPKLENTIRFDSYEVEDGSFTIIRTVEISEESAKEIFEYMDGIQLISEN